MPVKPPRARLPSLNALRAFEAAARCGSFAKAAEELGVTAGAVTQQVRQLEAWLGFALFRRLPQGVELSAAAREALPKLSRGFDVLGQAIQELRASHEGRTITLAALPCIAQLWLSPRLGRLQEAFPGLQVSVSAMEQPPDPRRDPHDLALFYRACEASTGEVLALPPDTLFPVCAPALAKRLADPAELRGVQLLHDAVWRYDWARWLGFAKVSGVDPGRGASFSLYSLALDAALSGTGVLMGRASLVAPHLRDGRLAAPFRVHMPTGDALTITLGADDSAHASRREIAQRLLAL
jgi:LysR family glycine cleavage system transcriptional activator